MFTYGVDADRPSIHFAWPGTCAMSRVRVHIPSSLCNAGSEGPVAHLPSPPSASASALEAATAALHGRRAHDIPAHHATSSGQHRRRAPCDRATCRIDSPRRSRACGADRPRHLPGGALHRRSSASSCAIRAACSAATRRSSAHASPASAAHAANAPSEVLHAACERATRGRPLTTATRADGQPARHGRASCTKRRTQQAQASFSWPPLYWRRRTQA